MIYYAYITHTYIYILYHHKMAYVILYILYDILIAIIMRTQWSLIIASDKWNKLSTQERPPVVNWFIDVCNAF